jgi:hypothetical protein
MKEMIKNSGAFAGDDISLNGRKLSRGKDYQTGLIQGLDESQTVLWLSVSSSVPVEITVSAGRKAQSKE